MHAQLILILSTLCQKKCLPFFNSCCCKTLGCRHKSYGYHQSKVARRVRKYEAVVVALARPYSHIDFAFGVQNSFLFLLPYFTAFEVNVNGCSALLLSKTLALISHICYVRKLAFPKTSITKSTCKRVKNGPKFFSCKNPGWTLHLSTTRKEAFFLGP